MTPSEERKFKKDIKDLLASNAALDAKQEKEIGELKAFVGKLAQRVKVLEQSKTAPKTSGR